jgi:hypothetical protein
MVRIDDRREAHALSLEVGPDVVGGAIERDPEDGEPLGRELLVQALPDRQLFAAASPGGVGVEKDLPAAVIGEPVPAPGDVRELEVRRCEALEAPLLVHGRLAEGGRSAVEVERERTAEDVCEHREVDVVPDHEIAAMPDRDAERTLTEAFRLELEPERRRQIRAREERSPVSNRGLAGPEATVGQQCEGAPRHRPRS